MIARAVAISFPPPEQDFCEAPTVIIDPVTLFTLLAIARAELVECGRAGYVETIDRLQQEGFAYGITGLLGVDLVQGILADAFVEVPRC